MNLAPLSRTAILFFIFGGLVAAPRRAEACDPALPRIRVWNPVGAAAGVPTNTQLWLTGEVGQVTLMAGAQTVATTMSRLAPHVLLTQVRPVQALSPRTLYTVSATGPYDTEPVTFAFMTGEAAELTPPAPTEEIRITAQRTVQSDLGSCVSHPAGYNLTIEADPVAGAAFYELLEVGEPGEGGFELLTVAVEPRFFVFTQTLPSPRFVILPVGSSGHAADAEASPSAQADGGDGGCSAAGSSSGASSSALWLSAAVIGWSLWQRRRRRGVRSLADLGLS